MSSPNATGFLVGILEKCKLDQTHVEHSDACIYLAKFRALEETFYSEVHPQTDTGLAISETQRAHNSPPNIFTTHGVIHIHELIKNLDKLANALSERWQMSALEAYILLNAAHVHDAANVEERRGHPQRCAEIIRRYNQLFAGSPAQQQICDVASAHGGLHPDHGPDTFRAIDSDNFTSPRLVLLAALLRLGDELSENANRVPNRVRQHHEESPQSTLAHAYARSFSSFELRKETLYITYNVYPEQRNLAVKIDGKPNHFFDFLEKKIETIEAESRYCSQYGSPIFFIRQIGIKINAHNNPEPSERSIRRSFNLFLAHGYPEKNTSICTRSPELKESGIHRLADWFPEAGSDRVVSLKAESISKTNDFDSTDNLQGFSLRKKMSNGLKFIQGLLR